MDKSSGFKFRAINKRLIESLVTGEVFFSTPSQLNDPFDCQIDIEKSLQSAIDQVCGDRKKLLLTHQQSLKKVFSEVDQLIKTFGVWSCSLELNNSLMWAHYGDEHKGICLQYEIPEKFSEYEKGEFVGIHPVEYGENPITDWFVESSDVNGNLPDFRNFVTSLAVKLVVSKDICWEYEKEGRVISRSSGLKEIGKSSLKQVCFGLRTPDADKRLIENILVTQGYSVTLCKMVRAKDDFGVEAIEI